MCTANRKQWESLIRTSYKAKSISRLARKKRKLYLLRRTQKKKKSANPQASPNGILLWLSLFEIYNHWANYFFFHESGNFSSLAFFAHTHLLGFACSVIYWCNLPRLNSEELVNAKTMRFLCRQRHAELVGWLQQWLPNSTMSLPKRMIFLFFWMRRPEQRL